MSARSSLQAGLEAAYGQLTEVASGLTDATALLPTRCAGWAVSDVLYHQLLDARQARRCRTAGTTPRARSRALAGVR